MKLYVYDIVGSYKDSIIGHLRKSGTEDLLLHIVQCWRWGVFDKQNRYFPIVMYCSGMMYKYYSCLKVFLVNTQLGRKVY